MRCISAQAHTKRTNQPPATPTARPARVVNRVVLLRDCARFQDALCWRVGSLSALLAASCAAHTFDAWVSASHSTSQAVHSLEALKHGPMADAELIHAVEAAISQMQDSRVDAQSTLSAFTDHDIRTTWQLLALSDSDWQTVAPGLSIGMRAAIKALAARPMIQSQPAVTKENAEVLWQH